MNSIWSRLRRPSWVEYSKRSPPSITLRLLIGPLYHSFLCHIPTVWIMTWLLYDLFLPCISTYPIRPIASPQYNKSLFYESVSLDTLTGALLNFFTLTFISLGIAFTSSPRGFQLFKSILNNLIYKYSSWYELQDKRADPVPQSLLNTQSQHVICWQRRFHHHT